MKTDIRILEMDAVNGMCHVFTCNNKILLVKHMKFFTFNQKDCTF